MAWCFEENPVENAPVMPAAWSGAEHFSAIFSLKNAWYPW
jgi:hypothetical protein